MKIVLINGSHRKNGATGKILSEFATKLSNKQDVELQIFQLSDLQLKYCVGCSQCFRTGECMIDDDIEMMSKSISNADGIIIASPNYVSNISGQLKTVIDRGHFVIEQLLKGKHALGIVTYENADGNATFNVLKKLFVFSGAATCDKLIVKLPFNSNPLEDSKITQLIDKKSKRFYSSISNKRFGNIYVRMIQTLTFNIGIKPFVLKKGDKYKGVLKHWKERGISFGNI